MYVCVYVAIRRPCAHHTYRACVQIDMIKIIRVCRVLTLNVAHQTTEEGFFEAQADIEETRKRRGRESVHKSSIFL